MNNQMSPNEIKTPIASLNLEEQRVLAEALFTSIGDGAIATDEFGKITRVNPTALQLLGYGEREMIGAWFPKKIVSIYENGEPISLIDRPITRAFLTGKAVTERTYYRKRNGQVMPVALTVSPIMLNGKPVGAIEVFRDITLEYEIDRMKSDFISLASHQLRTPLSAIKTYSHMLMDGYMGEVNDSQKKSLHTIVSAANRMNELISTLLNITRIESGNVTITLKDVNLERLAEEVIKEHSLAATDKEIEMKLECGSKTLQPIQTDALLFKEVISNLVSNAIKYTPNGGNVTICIKNRRYDVLMSVQDTGMGIPKYSQEHIFTKFFRAHNVVKQETSGTGLGLYLVKGLVDALGGKIWFESHENKGTIFYVALSKSRQDGKNTAGSLQ
jgi:PAS domain S-box-containing protein